MSRLIDADALIPDFLVPTSANNTPCKRYVSMEQIHNAPTIEPEQTGKWINVGDGNYICSECGCNPITYIGATRRLDNYMDLLDGLCPNCGAKMDKRQKHLGNESDLIVLDEVTFNIKRGDEDEVN